MKNLYAISGLLLMCSCLISGCKTLFDVEPKGIDFPIALGKLVVGPVPDVNKQPTPNMAKISYSKPDPLYTYGVLAFYDSSDAAAFVRKRTIIGAVQPIILGKTADSVSVNVSFDNTRGQYLYVTPFAYKAGSEQDSIAIFIRQDFTKAFSSKGYVQVKISPWTYIASLPGPNVDGVPVLLPVNNKLQLITYKSLAGTIYNYELDEKNNWIAKGSFPSKFAVTGSTTQTRSVMGLANAYFANNEYRLFVSSTKQGQGVASADSYGSGELVADQTFKFKSFENPLDITSYYPFVNIQGDRVVVIRNSATFNPSGFETKGYSTTLSTKKTIAYSTTEINSGLAFVITNELGTRLIANSNQPNTFTTYNLDDRGLANVATALFSESSVNKPVLWSGGSVLGISEGDHAFVVNNTLNIYRVQLYTGTPQRLNQPFFNAIYSGWFPAKSSSGISTGLPFGDSVWFVVNKNELWKINLNKLNGGIPRIDFIGGVTPIYVIPK